MAALHTCAHRAYRVLHCIGDEKTTLFYLGSVFIQYTVIFSPFVSGTVYLASCMLNGDNYFVG